MEEIIEKYPMLCFASSFVSLYFLGKLIRWGDKKSGMKEDK